MLYSHKSIADVEEDDEGIIVTGRIIESSDVREFDRTDGSKGYVKSLEIADNSGSINVTLWNENAKYLKSIRESKNGYGFDDIGMGAAYAYSTMYQKIVEGYRNGTREVYVCDNPESGKRRLLSMDEELEKLNKGFEELIKWDKMVAKSQKQNAENKQKFQNTKLDESFDAFDINQACDYIQDSYLEFRSLYLEQYERTGGNIDIKSLFSSVLRSGNQDMHKYCEFLFEKIGFIV